MISERTARVGTGPCPRVVPEVVEILTPERPDGLEGAMAAWRRVMARLSAPAFDVGRLAAALELGGLAGRVLGGQGMAAGPGAGAGVDGRR